SELVGLQISVASAHLRGDLADPALDSKLFGLEGVRAGIAVRERPLESGARLLVTCRGALDERIELIAKRAEVDGHVRGHPDDYHAASARVHGPRGLSSACVRPMPLDPGRTG